MRLSTYIFTVLTARFRQPKETSPSFAGKNVIVTGGNAGVGLEAARKFVQLGADKVVLAVRTWSKGEAARHKIEESTGRKGVIEVWQLDMMNYDSIRAFAERATNELPHLDIAVLNAGVIKTAHQKSSYGWEETLQVNVLSTALLGILLLPKLEAGKTPTYTPVLEIVASGTSLIVHSFPTPESPLAGCNSAEKYVGTWQYSVSKLFDLYIQTGLVGLLNAKNGEASRQANVVSVCPGPTQSELARDSQSGPLPIRAILWLFTNFVQYPGEVGARTYISGVALGDEGHGKFWRSDRFSETPPLMEGEAGKKYQQRAWEEIIEALEKDVPDVRQMIARI